MSLKIDSTKLLVGPPPPVPAFLRGPQKATLGEMGKNMSLPICLDRPKMVRYHAVTAEGVPNVLCKEQYFVFPNKWEFYYVESDEESDWDSDEEDWMKYEKPGDSKEMNAFVDFCKEHVENVVARMKVEKKKKLESGRGKAPLHWYVMKELSSMSESK